MKKKLIIVGGHGSGEIAMSIFQDINKVTNEWDIEGYLNDIVDPGQFLGEHKVLGPSEAVMDYVNKGYYVHYTLHLNAKQKAERVKRLEGFKIPCEANASGIHPTAIITPGAMIGHGVLINQFAICQVNCLIDDFVHVYSGSLVGHDSKINKYATVAAHSIVGGRVNVGHGAHIGLNSSIREDIKIGEYAIIGMGAVVVKDVLDNSVVVGNPAKPIR